MDPIDGFIAITNAVAPTVSKEKMKQDWIQMLTEVKAIVPATANSETFVPLVHEYIRVTRNYKYTKYGWDVFFAITQREGCNCICSSLLIALLGAYFDHFPNDIVVGQSPEHAFIMTTDRQNFFETTQLCQSSWIPRKIYFTRYINLNPTHDDILPISNIGQLLQAYAYEAGAYNIRRDRDIYAICDQYAHPPIPHYPYLINNIYSNPLFPGYYSSQQYIDDILELLMRLRPNMP
jgi:hypothetical protein